MEFLNRIELKGVVGRPDLNLVNGSQVCNFSVVTEYSTVDREGNPNVEVTWFNVSAWEGREGIPELHKIQKGAWVYVSGRLRLRKYTRENNEEKISVEVLARTVKLIPRGEDDALMQPQRDW